MNLRIGFLIFFALLAEIVFGAFAWEIGTLIFEATRNAALLFAVLIVGFNLIFLSPILVVVLLKIQLKRSEKQLQELYDAYPPEEYQEAEENPRTRVGSPSDETKTLSDTTTAPGGAKVSPYMTVLGVLLLALEFALLYRIWMWVSPHFQSLLTSSGVVMAILIFIHFAVAAPFIVRLRRRDEMPFISQRNSKDTENTTTNADNDESSKEFTVIDLLFMIVLLCGFIGASCVLLLYLILAPESSKEFPPDNPVLNIALPIGAVLGILGLLSICWGAILAIISVLLPRWRPLE